MGSVIPGLLHAHDDFHDQMLFLIMAPNALTPNNGTVKPPVSTLLSASSIVILVSIQSFVISVIE